MAHPTPEHVLRQRWAFALRHDTDGLAGLFAPTA